MNTTSSRTLSAICESCISRMQGVAEMLLLSCSVRPVLTDTTKHLPPDNLHTTINSKLKSISVLSESLVSHVHLLSTKWSDICESLQDLSAAIVHFMEIISHVTYLITIHFSKCCNAESGLVDKYSVCYSGLEIKLSCTRLKRTRVDELSPQIIIDLCSNISKHIAVITDICKTAGQNIHDESLEDQFKLSVKSVTCAAGCLIASIKSYRTSPNVTHHSRVVLFCEPVLASSQALVSFATEKDFIGDEGVLTSQAKEIQKRILGACMNIVSSCIQLCKTVRDLTYDLMTSHHKERLQSCLESIGHGSRKLLRVLDEYDINKLFKDYQSLQMGTLRLHPSCTLPDHSASTLDSKFGNSPSVSPIDNRSLVETISSQSLDNSSQSDQVHHHSNSNHDNQSDNSTSFTSSENSLASR